MISSLISYSVYDMSSEIASYFHFFFTHVTYNQQ